jgi:hypothetical protein
MEEALDAARAILAAWGVTVTPRPEGAAAPGLLAHDIDVGGYERRAGG